MTRTVIAGGGLAAQRCCETLRARGEEGPITIVCAESRPPYDRPPLSKAVLAAAGTDPAFRERGWYAERDVELLLGTRARRVDAAARRLVLDSGEQLAYDQLLIATGARPLMLPALAGRENAQALRTLDDALRLRDALRTGARIAILGAGLIGQEVAATAVAAGARVTLIDAAPAPFDALVGSALGGWLAALHRDAGVDLRLGARLEAVDGDGRVEALLLADGERVRCDHVVAGVGVRPDTQWLDGSGLGPLGVIVDCNGRTAAPGVFAAGDAALVRDPLTGRPASAGHWEAAARQGTAAARAMLGLPRLAAAPPLVWSDQHGLRIQRVGDPRGAEDAVVDGDLRARDFTVTYLRAGRPVAAVLAGRPGALPSVRRRLQVAAPPRPERNAA